MRISARMPLSRSIPACAGEPICAGPIPTGAGVYPRVCGGTNLRWADTNGRGGLSPRVRGNLHHKKAAA